MHVLHAVPCSLLGGLKHRRFASKRELWWLGANTPAQMRVAAAARRRTPSTTMPPVMK